MKRKLLKTMALLTVGFGVAFANPNQGLDQQGKTSDQKSQDALDRLNKDLSNIPQNMKNCIFNASTIDQLEDCHKQSKEPVMQKNQSK